MYHYNSKGEKVSVNKQQVTEHFGGDNPKSKDNKWIWIVVAIVVVVVLVGLFIWLRGNSGSSSASMGMTRGHMGAQRWGFRFY